MSDDGTTREDLTITENCNPSTAEGAKAMIEKLDTDQAVLVCDVVIKINVYQVTNLCLFLT